MQQWLKNRSVLLALGGAFVLFLLLVNLKTSWPDYDWDMVGYVATAYQFTQDDPDKIHSDTFADMKAGLPGDEYKKFLGQDRPPGNFREIVAGDPQSLKEVTPIYAVKPLYPALLLTLNHFGLGMVDAAVWISRISYLLTGLLLYFWFSRHYSAIISIIPAILAASTTVVLKSVEQTTPDALSTLILLYAFFLFVETSQHKLAFLILLFSVTARPDNIILLMFLTAFSFLNGRERKVFPLAVAAGGLGIYALQVSYSGYYGWSTIFHHTFMGTLNYPATEPFSFAFTDYLTILFHNSFPFHMRGANSYSLTLFLLLSLVTLKMYYTN